MSNKFTPACVPQHTHDCTACVFLGRMAQGVSSYDLYFCPAGQSSMGGTLLARFGSDGPQYHSMPIDIYHNVELPTSLYVQIYEAAKARGLVT